MNQKPIKFKIKLGNPVFYSLITIIILSALAGITIATNPWDIFGHDATEVGSSSGNSVQTRLCALENVAGDPVPDASCSATPSRCTSSADCTDATKPICVSPGPTTGHCEQCGANTPDCNSFTNKHKCDSSDWTCQNCTAATDCPSGWSCTNRQCTQPATQRWKLVATLTGQKGATVHKAFPLPSECKTTSGCRIQYQVLSSYSIAEGIWNRTYKITSGNNWESPVEPTPQNIKTSGTNGNAAKTGIFAERHKSLDDGTMLAEYYFRDDCAIESSPNYACVTMFLRSDVANPALNVQNIWVYTSDTNP